MTKEQFGQLKVGDRVTLTTDYQTLNNHGVSLPPGSVQIVHSTPGSGRAYIANGSYYVEPSDLQDNQTTPPPGKINRESVENIRRDGGNNALITAATSQLQLAINALNLAKTRTPQDSFVVNIKLAEDHIRATKMMNASLVK